MNSIPYTNPYQHLKTEPKKPESIPVNKTFNEVEKDINQILNNINVGFKKN